MTYLVDTDRAVDWLKGRRDAMDLFVRLSPDGLAISVISIGELYEGIYFGQDPVAAEQRLRFLRRMVDTAPMTEAVLLTFARVRGELRRAGNSIPDMDLLIAASAIHFDLTLVTRNVRHFSRVPGLRLHDYS